MFTFFQNSTCLIYKNVDYCLQIVANIYKYTLELSYNCQYFTYMSHIYHLYVTYMSPNILTNPYPHPSLVQKDKLFSLATFYTGLQKKGTVEECLTYLSTLIYSDSGDGGDVGSGQNSGGSDNGNSGGSDNKSIRRKSSAGVVSDAKCNEVKADIGGGDNVVGTIVTGGDSGGGIDGNSGGGGIDCTGTVNMDGVEGCDNDRIETKVGIKRNRSGDVINSRRGRGNVMKSRGGRGGVINSRGGRGNIMKSRRGRGGVINSRGGRGNIMKSRGGRGGVINSRGGRGNIMKSRRGRGGVINSRGGRGNVMKSRGGRGDGVDSHVCIKSDPDKGGDVASNNGGGNAIVGGSGIIGSNRDSDDDDNMIGTESTAVVGDGDYTSAGGADAGVVGVESGGGGDCNGDVSGPRRCPSPVEVMWTFHAKRGLSVPYPRVGVRSHVYDVAMNTFNDIHFIKQVPLPPLLS